MWPAAGSTLAIVRSRSQNKITWTEHIKQERVLSLTYVHHTRSVELHIISCPDVQHVQLTTNQSSFHNPAALVAWLVTTRCAVWTVSVCISIYCVSCILSLCGDCGYTSSSQPAPHAAGPGHGEYLLLTKTQTCRRCVTMFGTKLVAWPQWPQWFLMFTKICQKWKQWMSASRPLPFSLLRSEHSQTSLTCLSARNVRPGRTLLHKSGAARVCWNALSTRVLC